MPAAGDQRVQSEMGSTVSDRTVGKNSVFSVNGLNAIIQITKSRSQSFKMKLERRKMVAGIIITSLGSVCYAGFTIFTRNTYSPPNLKSPFLTVYLVSLVHVVYYLGRMVAELLTRRCNFSLRVAFRNDIVIFQYERQHKRPGHILCFLLAACLLWSISHYFYIRSLTFIGPIDAIALSGTSSSLVYLMSWIFLQRRFVALRIVAFIIAMAATILIAYMHLESKLSSLWGCMLVMFSLSAMTFAKILLPKCFGETNMQQQCLLVTTIGLMHSILLWPILLLLHFTSAEPFQNHGPWGPIFGLVGCALGKTFLQLFGHFMTYEVFVLSTYIIALPIAVGLEALAGQSVSVNGMQIAAYVLVIVSHATTSIPEALYDHLLQRLNLAQDEQYLRDEAHLTPRERLRTSTSQF